MKKDGGTIEKWQMHTLADTENALAYVKEQVPEFDMERAVVFTGTIVEDPTGRWEVGYHMRSSLVLNYDKETGICETRNTIYKLLGEEGGDIFGDMGTGVGAIFYQ